MAAGGVYVLALLRKPPHSADPCRAPQGKSGESSDPFSHDKTFQLEQDADEAGAGAGCPSQMEGERYQTENFFCDGLLGVSSRMSCAARYSLLCPVCPAPVV